MQVGRRPSADQVCKRRRQLTFRRLKEAMLAQLSEEGAPTVMGLEVTQGNV